MTPMTDLPLIFVTVGTDHHRFDRLIDWVDGWISSGSISRARVIVQHGTSREPRHGDGHPYLPHGEMVRMLAKATGVVCHAGPGTVSAARRAGLIPIVVPRRRALGEHVDDHQAAFAPHLARSGLAHVPESEEQFRRLLDQLMVHPGSFRTTDERPDDAAVRAFGRVLDDLGEQRSGAPSGASRVRVLYIGGVGRSGTTLLDRILGELPGVFSAGELVHLWRRGFIEGDLCGCGEPFTACRFWNEVGIRAFGGWERIGPARVVDLQNRVDRHRYLPFYLVPTASPRHRRASYLFRGILSSLYRAIAEVSGATLIVDSSKHASYAFALRGASDLDMRVVHMVRASPAVAYSWTKRVKRPEVADETTFMARYEPSTMGTRWLAYNGLFEALRLLGVPTLRVRYEDLVSDLEQEVSRVARFAGRRPELGFLEDGAVLLRKGHSASGNPMRFASGRIPVRIDDEWREKLDANGKRVVSAITWPLLRLYGYRGAWR